VTERYAHLKTDLFSATDVAAVAVDLAPGASEPGRLATPGASEQLSDNHRPRGTEAGTATQEVDAHAATS